MFLAVRIKLSVVLWGFEALIMVTMKISAFRNETLYTFVDRYQCFGGICYPHLQVTQKTQEGMGAENWCEMAESYKPFN
jgi:hypothetical protein